MSDIQKRAANWQSVYTRREGTWGSGGIAPLILNLGHYMELNCRPHVPASIAPGKEPWYELNRRLVSVIFTRRGVFSSVCGKFHMVKGKSGPRSPEGSRKLRFPDYVTVAQDGGKVVSLTHRPHLPSRKYSWYSFLLEDYINEKFQ